MSAALGSGVAADGAVARDETRLQADPSAVASDPESTVLALGEPVERELTGGRGDVYRLPSQEGAYLRAVVVQRGIDVALRLVGPDGSTAAEADVSGESFGIEELVAVLAEPGPFRLAIESRGEGAWAGTYEATIAELRPATAEDRTRAEVAVAAAADLLACRDLYMEDRMEASGRAVARCEAARSGFARAGLENGEAWALQTLGHLRYRLGEREPALEQLRAALVLFRRGDDVWGEATTLYRTGSVLLVLGRYEEASAAFQASLELWRRFADEPAQAWAVNGLGRVLERQGRYLEAIEHYRAAYELWGSKGDLPGQNLARFNLGRATWYLGDARGALRQYQAVLGGLADSPDPRLEGWVVISLGAVYTHLGENQEALDAYERARQLAKEVGDQDSLGALLQNAAGLYLGLGDHATALERYWEAVELFRDLGERSKEAYTLRNVGWAYHLRGEHRRAIELLEEALDLSRQIGDRQTEALALHGRGVVEAAMGEPSQALLDLREALRLRSEAGNRAGQGATLSELGQIHLGLGEAQDARASLDRALDLATELGDLQLEAVTRGRLARLDRLAGNLDQAQRHLEAALNIYESLRGSVVGQELRATALSFRREYYELYASLLLALARQRPGTGYETAALRASERARARGLVELLAEAKVDVERGVDPELKRRERELQARISDVQRRLLLPDLETDQREALQRELEEVRGNRRRLEGEIRTQSPLYGGLVYPDPLDLSRIQRLLGPETALIQYLLGDEACVVFLVTQDDLRIFPLAAPYAEVVAEVTTLREALSGRERRRERSYARAAARLYELLVEPAMESLAGKQHLLVSPDRDLYFLPFEVLLTAAPARIDFSTLPYLVRRFRISYVPSATALASLPAAGAPEPQEGKSLVAFADPLYEGSGVLELPRLAASGEEVRRIAALFPPEEVVVFDRTRATEENVKRDRVVGTARRLHFAVHGLLDAQKPENIGLALTMAEGSDEDGLLQMGEIFDLELEADLVVLSACSSGLGKALAGEGLIGMVRAFFYAGTRSLVVSLWRVEDEATGELMVEFYRALVATADKAEALRRAKLAMLERGPGLSHPNLWAPFVVVGQPR